MAGIRINVGVKDYERLAGRIAFLKNGAGNKVIRQGLRSSLPPIRRSLKAKLMALRRTSKQSTGATIRSMATKVRYPGARQKGRGYALVGIDWDHYERHFKTTALDRRQASLKKRGLKLYGIKTNKKGVSTLVRSYQTSSARVSRKRNRRVQINRPAKYWHLINDGFRHYRSKKMVPGRKYADRAAREAGQAGMKNMVDIIEGYLTRAGFGK
jgi:hypothetical protein